MGSWGAVPQMHFGPFREKPLVWEEQAEGRRGRGVCGEGGGVEEKVRLACWSPLTLSTHTSDPHHAHLVSAKPLPSSRQHRGRREA